MTIRKRLGKLLEAGLPASFFVSYALTCARAVLPLNKNHEVIAKNLDIIEGYMKGTNTMAELEKARENIYRARATYTHNAAAYAAYAANVATAAADAADAYATDAAAYATDAAAYATNAAYAATNAAKKARVEFDAEKLLDSMLANISKLEKEYYKISL